MGLAACCQGHARTTRGGVQEGLRETKGVSP